MATNYQRGVLVEHKAAQELEALGYLVIRAAGSHGPADLVAIGPAGVRLVQCKRTKAKPGSGLRGPLRELASLRLPENATAEIWQWCDGQGWARWLVDGPIPAGWSGGLADN